MFISKGQNKWYKCLQAKTLPVDVRYAILPIHNNLTKHEMLIKRPHGKPMVALFAKFKYVKRAFIVIREQLNSGVLYSEIEFMLEANTKRNNNTNSIMFQVCFWKLVKMQ